MNNVNKGLCEECSYYRELKYKPALNAHLCELCYDLPTDKRNTEMRMNEYQELASRTAKEDPEEVINYGLGVSGEAGEVADMIKKRRFQGHTFSKEEICKELGDVLWYVSQLARMHGLTMDQVATANIIKLQKRYPEGFSEERSVNRNDHR